MLRLLLDECTDPAVVDAILAEQPDCSVTSVHRWRDRRYRGASDRVLLAAAMEEHLTLVTRDVKTIPRLLHEFFRLGQSHEGVVFVNESAFPRGDIGALAHALLDLWRTSRDLDWQNRTVFLRPSK